MKTPKPKKLTRAELVRKLKEMEAQHASTYHFASFGLPKAGDNLMASAVILELTALGGREIIPPVAIVNGLSKETIEAIQKDISRSWKWKTEMKPKGVSEEQLAKPQ